MREVIALMNAPEPGGNTPAKLFELCAPGIELDLSRRVFNPTVYRGHEGMRELARDTFQVWERFTIEPERITRLDNGEIEVVELRRGRGRESGISIDQRSTSRWTVRDGRIVRLEVDVNPPSEA